MYLRKLRQRAIRNAATRLRLTKSAERAGLTLAEMRDALDAPAAAFTIEYAEAHLFCQFVHDQLAEALASAEAAKAFHQQITLTPEDRQELGSVPPPPEQFLEWLQQRGYQDAVQSLVRKQITAALLSDFLLFIDQALQCSVAGRLTVAFALLRKPFKDNLLYFEWILADPDDFFRRFDLGPDELSVRAEARVPLIRMAMERSSLRVWADPAFIHELRFDKQSIVGFEPTWQQALHLVTTKKGVATEARNFNFVFSDSAALESQWRQLYGVLPILLFYALHIIEGLLGTFARRANPADVTPLRTLAGFILWLRSSACVVEAEDLAERFRTLLDAMDCPACQKTLPNDDRALRDLYHDSEIRCSSCGTQVNFDTSKSAQAMGG